jgi:hypothetical protein
LGNPFCASIHIFSNVRLLSDWLALSLYFLILSLNTSAVWFSCSFIFSHFFRPTAIILCLYFHVLYFLWFILQFFLTWFSNWVFFPFPYSLSYFIFSFLLLACIKSFFLYLPKSDSFRCVFLSCLFLSSFSSLFILLKLFISCIFLVSFFSLSLSVRFLFLGYLFIYFIFHILFLSESGIYHFLIFHFSFILFHFWYFLYFISIFLNSLFLYFLDSFVYLFLMCSLFNLVLFLSYYSFLYLVFYTPHTQDKDMTNTNEKELN